MLRKGEQTKPMDTACWRIRDCDSEMARCCPHATASADGRCVISCYYTNCSRPQYQIATDLALLLTPDVDRRAAIKESCEYCAFFLRHGPRLTDQANTQTVCGDAPNNHV
ncbi:MAG: hypothetical protein LBU07_00475 [Coriobacteriales bacterium]|nr:hypothetical protein [Coriobacteriales bacterium]